MLVNKGSDKLQEAFHAMSEDCAARYLNLGQMLAEQFPRPATLSLCLPAEAVEMTALQLIGELAPAGMCVVRWSDRKIVWANAAYKRFYAELEQRKLQEGMGIDEVLPEFHTSGMEPIFEQVATTGEPFQINSFPLDLPNAGRTYWDWSLTLLPFALDGGPKLLIQTTRALAPRISLAA